LGSGAWLPAARAGISARSVPFPATTGSLVVFDPFEPHAILESTAIRYNPDDYQGTERNLFLGFEITLAPAVRTVFGIGRSGTVPQPFRAGSQSTPRPGRWLHQPLDVGSDRVARL
jgi:hypothetical protein